MLKHIAFIPDGNRRYAKKENISLLEAYQRGFDKAEEVFGWCLEVPGLSTATVYALSTENLARTPEELEVLLSLYDRNFRSLARNERIHSNGVRVRVVGNSPLNGLSGAVSELESATAGYSGYNLNIALGYGGRAEIIDAVRNAYRDMGSGIASIDEASFSKYLRVPGEPDLLVRTGGTKRLSNFMPWQCAYSELHFSEALWPGFTRGDFDAAVGDFNERKRNFGK